MWRNKRNEPVCKNCAADQEDSWEDIEKAMDWCEHDFQRSFYFLYMACRKEKCPSCGMEIFIVKDEELEHCSSCGWNRDE